MNRHDTDIYNEGKTDAANGYGLSDNPRHYGGDALRIWRDGIAAALHAEGDATYHETRSLDRWAVTATEGRR